MLPADAADANPTFPSFGLLGSTAAFVPIPVGNANVKLSRTVGNDVTYLPPPPGHGAGVVKWEKDPLAGPNGFAVKLLTAQARTLTSVRQWRGLYAASFPDGVVGNRHTPAAKQLAEFARGLLTHAAALHAAGWRLGLLSPDSAYLSSSDPARVFLPDLGFAWLGQMALTKPAWLSSEPTDQSLWGEERKTRQLCAPEQYAKRHPSANDPAALVQQDLKAVAKLLAFMLNGQIGGAEPLGAKRCPVWATVRATTAGKFVGTDDVSPAEQMLEHLLTGLKAPLDTTPKAAPEKKGRLGLLLALGFVFLVLAGGAVAIWWFWQKGQELATASSGAITTSSDTDTTPPTDTTPTGTPPTDTKPPATTPKPPDPPMRGESIIDLAKRDPQNPMVLAALSELRAEVKRLYPEARAGSVSAARRARDLQDQIDQIMKAQNTQEVLK